MNFTKPFCRYLSTVALADFAVACMAWYGNRLPSVFPEAVFLLLMLPGGIFLLGMACGVIWGGAWGLRWRVLAGYSLVTLLLFPLPYFMVSDREWFWVFFWYANGQQCAGFVLGAWVRMDCVRRRARENACDCTEEPDAAGNCK